MSSRHEAKEAVAAIAKNFGDIDDHMWARLEAFDPAMRRCFEEAMLAKDQLAGHSIKTLATQLYGSEARFVFELLQNADDNSFKRAERESAEPNISFAVHPDRIVVECNEDGFTVENLKAICAVSKSTKSTSHGYIGTKGIGFKSVFMAAWKVHIESGHFSFSFKHTAGQLGLGMVLPRWEDTDGELDGPLTRMTLYLHEGGDPTELEKRRQIIFKQLSDLQQTCLLFFRNLRSINIAFYDQNCELTSSKQFRMDCVDDHRRSLKALIANGHESRETLEALYHLTRATVHNVPSSDSRRDPVTSQPAAGASTTEVVLAFPITAHFDPVISRQELFAFLPLRESGFKFLIHSDFDTSANRQDVVTTSSRNLYLLRVIAKTFIGAVAQFSRNPKLCYSWPLFLPSDTSFDSFWSTVDAEIRSILATTPVLKSRHCVPLRKLTDVVILTKDFLDEDGEPLIDDVSLDPFLATGYSTGCAAILKRYGLGNMQHSHVLSLLESDLVSSSSKMHSQDTSQSWHSAMAKVLIKIQRRLLEPLEIVPLTRREHSMSWHSLQGTAGLGSPRRTRQIYLPSTLGISVPTRVIWTLCPSAVANEDRKALFIYMGAMEPSVDKIRAKILSVTHRDFGVDISRAQLHYMYLSHGKGWRRGELDSICVHTVTGRLEKPHQDDVYLQNDHQYGPQALLESVDVASDVGVSFLHPSYQDDPPTSADPDLPTWTSWLHTYVGIRKRLRLVSSDGQRLSPAWNYAVSHRPEKFLGLLESIWKHQARDIKYNQDVRQKLMNTDARDLCGSQLASPYVLKDTYLPFPELRAVCEQFLEPSEKFPFLEFKDSPTWEHLGSKWAFLTAEFSVKRHDDTSFLLQILRSIREQNPDASSVCRPKRILELYITIQECPMRFGNLITPDAIKDFFETHDCLWVPAQGGEEARWVATYECVWEAPPTMSSRYPLQRPYAELLGKERFQLLQKLCSYHLGIKAASAMDLTDELTELRAFGCQDFDQILGVYQYLGQVTDEESLRLLRVMFATNDMIYISTGHESKWLTTSQCIWASATEIRGMATLNDHYEDLKHFFVDILGVKTLTLQMVYDELVQPTAERTIHGAKQTTQTFNALLQTETNDFDAERMRESCVFPVRLPDGTVSLRSATTEFAITDREYLASRFRSHIKLLDYSMEEVRRLRPFFEWVGLTDRYLSAAVKEVTSIADGAKHPITRRNRDLKKKAYALLRVAATFDSPRVRDDVDGFYSILRTAVVAETDSLKSNLTIVQDRKPKMVEEPIGDTHISEIDGQLTIYVPKDMDAQDFCFASALPNSLADWLMRHSTTQIPDAVSSELIMVLTVLLSVDRTVVDRVLERHGIIEVPAVEEVVDEDEEDGEQEEEDVDGNSEENLNDDLGGEQAHDQQEAGAYSEAVDQATESLSSLALVRISTPPLNHRDRTLTLSQPHGSATSPNAGTPYATGQQRSSVGQSLTSRELASPSSPTIGSRRLNEENYKLFLETVSRAARLASFPRSTNRSGDVEPLRYSTVNMGLATINQVERLKYIGAAGELYVSAPLHISYTNGDCVFELLSKLSLSLPGWSYKNWQSTIRCYATVHPDHADMGAWNGRETADLVYKDWSGAFTAMLIDKEYLAADWEDARPTYYLEVKTTPGDCSTQFYMSKHQYRRMQDTHSARDRSKVYMVLRVSHIADGSIGMRVYLDPEQLRLDGELMFTAESYTVVPA